MSQPTDRPRVSKEPISVLLPVYNQAAALEPIAESWHRNLEKLGRPFEFIIIDDASTDETRKHADHLAARHPNVRVLRHDARRGFGACLRTGIAASQYPLVFYTSCTYPYQPTDLTKLLDVIDEVDVASGARSEAVPPWLRRVRALRWLITRVVLGYAPEHPPGWRGWSEWRQAAKLRLLFGPRVWDPSSAFKLFRRSVLERIPIQSDGEFVHAELLAKANFLGYLMTEVPIGRLSGNFRGVPEPPPPGADYAAERRRVFRRPTFAPPPEPQPASGGRQPPGEPCK